MPLYKNASLCVRLGPENLSKCNQGGWWSSSLLSRVMMMMMERPHFQRLMGSPDPQAIHMFVVGQNLFFFSSKINHSLLRSNEREALCFAQAQLSNDKSPNYQQERDPFLVKYDHCKLNQTTINISEFLPNCILMRKIHRNKSSLLSAEQYAAENAFISIMVLNNHFPSFFRYVIPA